MASLGMDSVLPAQLCKVREEGIYILYTANNHESGRHGQQDRHGRKRKRKRKAQGKG